MDLSSAAYGKCIRPLRSAIMPTPILWAENPKVEGSNPSPATNLFNRLRRLRVSRETPKNSH
jgi:hypothetical protein